MNNPIRTCVASAVLAAAALPGVALAGPGHHGGDASKRTELRVERVDLALEKAVDAIDDGDEAKAVAKLATVDKHLARALKAANRQADGDSGPGSLGLVAETADEVALTAADSMDGASQTLTDALEGSLDGSLDTRDAILVTISGLADPSDYKDVVVDIADASDDEAESFSEGAEDDELVASGVTALTDAAAQATTTSDAADLLAETAAGAPEDDEDCPRGERPEGTQESPRFRP